MTRRSACLLALISLGGCRSRETVASPALRFHEAEELWRQSDPAAFAAWASLDRSSVEGAAAHRRLDEAQALYRRGIDLLRSRDASAAEVLKEGRALAPIDPALYLPLARACRDRGYPERAGSFYRKYLAVATGAERAEADGELRALDPGFADPFEPAPIAVAAPSLSAPIEAGAASAIGLTLIAFYVGRRRRSLAELAAARPELHPAIAWLIGCLRHELLKHRIGAVADAVEALARGEATRTERDFLRARLFGGESIEREWRGHLASFDRALGPRFFVGRSDRSFREAGRTIAEIARLAGALERGDSDGKLVTRLADAHRRLRDFDRHLLGLCSGLSRTEVDVALLEEAVASVREEYAVAKVALDELGVGEVPRGIAVDVYRVDLLVILKNIVRNAIVAVGRGVAPRRVVIDVLVSVEPTGEEMVRVRVRDSSPEPLAAVAASDRRAGRGLGIVTAALDRYDGALEVLPAGEGFAKGVAVRLFRALDGDAIVGAAA